MRSRRTLGVIATGALVLVLSACGSGGKRSRSSSNAGSSTSTAAASSAASSTTLPSSTTTNTQVLATSTALPCQPLPIPNTPLKSPAPAQPVLLTTVQELGDRCVDHVVFGFKPTPDPPGYEVTYGTPPFTADASGAPVPVKGSAFIVVKVSPGYGFDFESGKATYTGPKRITPAGTNHVTEIVETGDFEGVLSWVIGLDAKRPFSVQATGAPQTQLVITVG